MNLRLDGHEPRFVRYPRGRAVLTGRPLYGYRVDCACGWSQRVNGTRQEAAQVHRAHRAALALITTDQEARP